MDPITSAILAALTSGVASTLTKASQAVINEGYQRIKTLIAHKFGETSEIARAVEQVEVKPDSAGRQATLQEEITVVGAHQDADLLHLAQELLQLIQKAEGAGPHIQTATGNYIAQADRGSSASVNVTGKEQP